MATSWRSLVGLLVGPFLLLNPTSTDVDVPQAQARTPIKATRIFTGQDGQTHSEELTVKLGSGPNASELSAMIDVAGLQFRRTPPNYFVDWHPAPRRQYVITLSGRGEIELTTGKIPIGPGHILLAEDVMGKGHITRGAGSDDRISLFIPLVDAPPGPADAEADVRALERAFNESRANSDLSTLDRMLADDWTITHGDGTIDTKTKYIADLRSGARKFEFVRQNDFSVRLHGDTAVAAGTTDSKVTLNGQPGGGALRFTRVYVRRSGRWQMIVSHATRRT